VEAAAPESVKSVIFWANTTFFGQKPVTKNEKKHLSVLIKRKKTEFILSSMMKCRKSGFFYWAG